MSVLPFICAPRDANQQQRRIHQQLCNDKEVISVQDFLFVQPDRVFYDARVRLHYRVDDPGTFCGRHYLTLKDHDHFIFVVAYRRSSDMSLNDTEAWQGGTQLEMPVEGLAPMLNALESHYHTASHLSLRSQAVFKYTKTVADEALCLTRDYVLPGYTVKNHSRKVHFPWAGQDWVQEFRLADSVLFDEGYCGALKQLVSGSG